MVCTYPLAFAQARIHALDKAAISKKGGVVRLLTSLPPRCCGAARHSSTTGVTAGLVGARERVQRPGARRGPGRPLGGLLRPLGESAPSPISSRPQTCDTV